MGGLYDYLRQKKIAIEKNSFGTNWPIKFQMAMILEKKPHFGNGDIIKAL